MRRYTFYLSVALLAFGIGSVNGYCQKQITKENYYQLFREASKKRFETSRRENIQLKEYKDGKLLYTVEILNKFLAPDKYHYISVEKFNDRIKKNESISINKIKYCKKNDADWKQTNEFCGYGSGSGGLSNIVSNKYTLEETKIGNQKAKLYKEYTIYKNTYSTNKDKEGLSYKQQKIWLNKDGFILHEEVESGLLEQKIIYSQYTSTYEYNPENLKIEAPIKAN